VTLDPLLFLYESNPILKIIVALLCIIQLGFAFWLKRGRDVIAVILVPLAVVALCILGVAYVGEFRGDDLSALFSVLIFGGAALLPLIPCTLASLVVIRLKSRRSTDMKAPVAPDI
jgi:amino acid permease